MPRLIRQGLRGLSRHLWAGEDISLRSIVEIWASGQFAERQAVNTPIQGTASDLIKLAMVKISEQIKDSGLKSKMILQIHDELVFDLPVTELDILTRLVKEKMEQVKKLDVPIKIDMKKGKNWLDMETVE